MLNTALDTESRAVALALKRQKHNLNQIQLVCLVFGGRVTHIENRGTLIA